MRKKSGIRISNIDLVVKEPPKEKDELSCINCGAPKKYLLPIIVEKDKETITYACQMCAEKFTP